MKKLLFFLSFIICITVLNIVSLDIITLTRSHGRLNNVEAYSLSEPSDVDSTYCAPFYIFDGLKKADVKVVGKTCFATISQTELQKLLFELDARVVKVNNSAKRIVNLYSPRLNSVTPIKQNRNKVNMQICVEGEKVQIGIPSLCGFI